MILNDFLCTSCGHVEEQFETKRTIKCSKCGKDSKKLISVSGVNTFTQDARWIRSIREVVEKGSGKQHCEEFLKDPTRKNYQNWMKGEGLRHLEPGEKAVKPDEAADHRRITKEVYDKHRKRCALEI